MVAAGEPTPLRALRTSVGLKQVLAVTGTILALFVLLHMAGNLLVFSGPEVYNVYAQKIQSSGALLYVARAVLLLVFLIHLGAGLRLAVLSRRARPVGYAVSGPVSASLASRTMVLTGFVLLAFVAYHLLHFTLGVVLPDVYQEMGPGHYRDVYSMFVLSFRQPLIAVSYLVAMGALFLHLVHGIPAIVQDLGLNPPAWQRVTGALGRLIAVLVWMGNVAMPLCCWLRLLPLPGEGS